MPFRYQVRRVFLAPALALTLGTALAACSGSAASSSSSTAATPSVISSGSVLPTTPPSTSAPASVASGGGSAAAIAAIKANWVKFFSSSTPNSERAALLQNGQSFTAAIKSFSASPLAAAVTSKVDSVKLSSASQAAVKYDLTAAGTSVASGQSGTAVLQGGVWKVGDDVFCGLLKQGATLMGMTVPAACK